MNEFDLPIKLKIPAGWTVFYFFGMIFFIFLAVLSSLDSRTGAGAVCFGPFVVLSIFTFISSRSYIEISQVSITLYSPPRGVYQIDWSEIEYLETNGQTFGFFGNNKRLVITLGFSSSKRMPEFYGFLRKFIEDNNVSIRPLSSKWLLTQKNTRIRSLYY